MKSNLNITNQVTEIFRKIAQSKTRYTILQGGTRSSKTYSMMQFIYIFALMNKENFWTFSVCAESLPHLKKGAMRDFFEYLKKNNVYDPKSHNKTDHKYIVGKFSIEFFGVDSAARVHGATRDFLFVNEIQNIKYETFFHLSQRTNKRVYADFNPTHDFFIFEYYIKNEAVQNDLTLIKSTYLDNPFLSAEITRDILTRAERDSNYRRVYIEGEVGSVEGLIFPSFTIIPSYPPFTKKGAYALDFGFSNDVTALVFCSIDEQGNLYISEGLYEVGLTCSDIIKKFERLEVSTKFPIFADSSRPEIIEEISRKGYNIRATRKISILEGIEKMKKYKIHITRASVNTIAEFRAYSWKEDKNGSRKKNIPEDANNHAIDAIRYYCVDALKNTKFGMVRRIETPSRLLYI